MLGLYYWVLYELAIYVAGEICPGGRARMAEGKST